MYRKILIAALLCLTLQQTAQAQHATKEKALMVSHGFDSVNYESYLPFFSFYRTIPTASSDTFIVWYIGGRPTTTTQGFYFTYDHYSKVVQVAADGWRVLGDTSYVSYENDSGQTVSINNFDPALSRGVQNRYLFSYSDIEAWYVDSQTALASVPHTQSEYEAVTGDTRTFYSSVNFSRDASELTKDSDLGGMSDWLEIFRNPRMSSYLNPRDDVPCSCGSCCSCTCTCGGYYGVLCGGLAGDCDCHKPLCFCGACCSCLCFCNGRWVTRCDGLPSSCSCHEVCICGACCVCKCTCGKWSSVSCDGTSGLGFGCSCHAQCSCGACCSCTCVCGDWKDATCGGDRTDCECHRNCICNACCSCRCTCGDWRGQTCNGGSYCDCHDCTCGACCSCKCTCGNWPSNILGTCGGKASDCDCHKQCSCGACCSCKCTCGNWQGDFCNGTAQYCDCHACQCGACCSCRCTCGQWAGFLCGGKSSDCDCHDNNYPPTDPDDPSECTCGACCSCKCVCGKWHLHYCGKTPEYCSCHEPIESNDWFPTEELQESFEHLQQKLKEKLGIDLQAMFENIQGSQFTEIRIEIPQILPGVPTTYIYFNLEDISQYTVVGVIRNLFLAVIFLTMVQVILVTLRQY